MIETEKYYGNYLGIVIQNNDPEQRGRVKIWIPHISATLYDGLNKPSEDMIFNFPGGEQQEQFTNIIGDLKKILPWAECASPLFGGDGTARYKALFQQAVVTDAAKGDTIKGQGIGNEVAAHNRQFHPSTSPESQKYVSSATKYRGKSRGMFTIPNVGAHLWVFFRNGNPSSPVYFAASHGEEDWHGIYKSSPATDYPGSYESKDKADGGDKDSRDNKTFRAKTVFNSNKHSLEFIDTDNHEILKLTHFNGSFQEFNNLAHIQFINGDDDAQILGDQFLTVRKNKNAYVEGTYELITKGPYINWIGLPEQDKVKQIVEKLKELHNYKRLFDLKRADYSDKGPRQLSKEQKRQGTFAVCPVCENKPYVPGDVWSGNALARSVPFYIPFITNTGIPAAQFQVMFYPDPPDPSTAVGVGQIGYYMGSQCDVCNSKTPIPLPNGHPGKGRSPSTEAGQWQADSQKREEIQKWIRENFYDLTTLERELGNSDHIVTIGKNKIETIGLVMNDIPSIRTDSYGKLRADGVHTAPEGTYTTYKPCPLVEYVDIDDIPGGDYNLTVSNKYKLLVGARGINIKTFGPIDMYGTIVNLVGEQINMVSQNDISIDGGERLTFRGRTIAISPYEHNPVVVDGQLHVTRNAIIQGATMIEGELGVTHITGPSQYYETLPSTAGTTEVSIGHAHGIPPHTHFFINLPINLLKSGIETRAKMITMGVNDTDSVQPGGKIGGVGNTAILGEDISKIPGVNKVNPEYKGPNHLIRNYNNTDWGGPAMDFIEAAATRGLQRGFSGEIIGEQISENEILYSSYWAGNAGDGEIGIPSKVYRFNITYKIKTININGKQILAVDNEIWRYENAIANGKTSIEAQKTKKNATQSILAIEKLSEDEEVQIHQMKSDGPMKAE
jgi:hypothetical protein